ncbi:hypothetical protein M569_05144, partial [Genlisea aurea]
NTAAAEKTLLSLSQSPSPYKTCQFVLENSQLANARFQAAGAIRDAALREWEFLGADDRKRLISFCLRFIMEHSNSPEGYVIVKVGAVAAQLLKRGWLEFTAVERELFFLEVKSAVHGTCGLPMQFSGIKFLESLISEFSPSTSSAMGLPREFHEHCLLSLEQDYLKEFYRWAQTAAFTVSSVIIGSNSEVPEVKVCSAAMSLMLQILNWDFRGNGTSRNSRGIDLFHGMKIAEMNLLRSECILVQPGPAWYDVLLSSGHVGWVLSFYAALRQKFSCEGYWLDCPLAVTARKLIIQLSCLVGNIFPDSEHVQRQHLMQLLAGIAEWLEPPEAVTNAIKNGKSESEMLDGCRGLLSIANVTTPIVFDDLLKSSRPYGTLTLLSAVMHEVMNDLMENNAEEETWSWEARDILLDTWTTLLTQLNGDGHNLLLEAEGVKAAANLFAMILKSEMKAASTSAFRDEDEIDYHLASVSAMDERLSSYALIARAAVGSTLPLLTEHFTDCVTRLQQSKGISDPTETLEQLYSLLLIIGHVLADEGLSETPLVPKEIERQYGFVTQVDKHPVIVLSTSIIKFAGRSLDPEDRTSIFSPRLMEAVVWFLARWSQTYLMPSIHSGGHDRGAHVGNDQPASENSKSLLLSFFGEDNQGIAVLDILLQLALITLVSYPGEKELQALTCRHLLHALVKRKNIVYHLGNLDSWRGFAHAFVNERAFFSLDGSHQRVLAQTFTLSAASVKNSELSYKYIENLTRHMTIYLVELSTKNDLKAIALQPDVILLVSCLLERLRGVARASEPCTQKAVYQVGSVLMRPIMILLEAYEDEFTVFYLLLKFVAEWVSVQLIYLEARESFAVVDFCLSVLQFYSSHNMRKVSIFRSSRLQYQADEEKYKDLRALIQLLSSLCSKDLIDFAAEPIEAYGSSICQVLYTGVCVLGPSITLDMLKFPKLCQSFFWLLSHLLEVYPDVISQLSVESASQIQGFIIFGLHNQDVEVVDLCLRAINAVASHHYKETSVGKVGLGIHASSYEVAGGNFHEGFLRKFLHSLMQLILFEEYSSDLVSAAADALLPLILCETSVYQNAANELIARQMNPTLKSRLSNAFRSLTASDNNLSSSLARQNLQIFRRNLHKFLIEVRGLLQTV